MTLLRLAPSGVRRIEDDFNTNVANLNNQFTSSRTSRWLKVFGADLGTNNGVVSTTNTTNTLYALEGLYGSFKATLVLTTNTGGNAFYFRVQDANNWIRIREFSEQGGTSSSCQNVITLSAFQDFGDNGSCSGIFSSDAIDEFIAAPCGDGQVVRFQNNWVFRPDCFPSQPWKLVSRSFFEYEASFTTTATRFYRTVLEKMTNGVLSTIQLGGTSSTSTNGSAYAALPARTIVAEITPSTIKVTANGFTVNVSDSSFSDSKTIGIGRGSSSLYTASGIDNLVVEVQ